MCDSTRATEDAVSRRSGAPRLVLASGSPQRREILTQLGLRFDVVVPGVEELMEGDPAALAVENARRKAVAVANGQRAGGDDATVLGVDTVVVVDGRAYGKPQDQDEAESLLRMLAGRAHGVLSGLCVVAGEGPPRTALATTSVRFRSLDEGVLDWYLKSGEWQGRAGGYAIQGRGAALVASISGDYLNVVGLPVGTLQDLVPGLIRAS